MLPSWYPYLLLIFHSSSGVMIWPAWISCRISSYSIQFCLTQLYQSHLFYKPTSMSSARKELHLHHQQLQLSMSYYWTTCSIPTNTLDHFCQDYKWLASFLLPIVLGHGWAWSSFAAFSHSLMTFIIDWMTINTHKHRHLHIWRLVSYGSWASSWGRLWTWRKQCWSRCWVKNE